MLQLRDTEFAQASRIEQIIKHYSNFVPFPIELNGNAVNTVQALWTKNRRARSPTRNTRSSTNIIGHDTEAPLYRLHFSADAPLAIRALLFVPPKSFEQLTMTRGESEVNLYCRKVLIQPKAKGLFPEWLRFLRGVVDSEDLPLNISRETMQDSALLRKLNDVLTKRVLKWLDEESEGGPGEIRPLFQGARPLPEGRRGHRLDAPRGDREAAALRVVVHRSGQDDVADRLREPHAGGAKGDLLSARAEPRSAEASPYFEVFREKKFEVLFLTDPRDEFVMEHLREFDEKSSSPRRKPTSSSTTRSTRLATTRRGCWRISSRKRLGDRVDEVRDFEAARRQPGGRRG